MLIFHPLFVGCTHTLPHPVIYGIQEAINARSVNPDCVLLRVLLKKHLYPHVVNTEGGYEAYPIKPYL